VITATLARIGREKHHDWEVFSRLKLTEDASLQRYDPLHPDANEIQDLVQGNITS
jgi:hypothetical protein